MGACSSSHFHNAPHGRDPQPTWLKWPVSGSALKTLPSHKMNLLKYLARIGYDGPIRADIETLRALQFAHMQTVPFENLDISLGRKIRLDEAGLWNKLI